MKSPKWVIKRDSGPFSYLQSKNPIYAYGGEQRYAIKFDSLEAAKRAMKWQVVWSSSWPARIVKLVPRKLRVWRNNIIEWVIATGPRDASRIINHELQHLEFDARRPIEDWEVVPDDKVIGVDMDGRIVKRTAAEWVDVNGRGFLATTEY